MTQQIQGVLPVLQTPYLDDFSIDWETLKREIDWLFDQGIDGVTIAMVSEVLRLTDAERVEMTRRVVEFTDGRGPVITSVGAESIHQALSHAEAAQEAGADALMAIPPTLTSCASDQVVAYYTALVQGTDRPIIIQDASGYVGNAIPVETQAALYREHPDRIMFKPEAQPFGPNITALREAAGPDASIFEGTGGIALVDSFQRGINGTMPGAEVPWALVALWKALQDGDMERARSIHEPLAALISLQHNLDAFLAVEKLILKHEGIFSNTLVRPPGGFVLEPQTEAEVLALVERIRSACERN